MADDNSQIQIEIPANNKITGKELIDLINELVDNAVQNRIGYYPPSDLRDGELWIKTYQDYPDEDAGQPSNLRELYIHFKNVVVNGEFKGDQSIKLGSFYVGDNAAAPSTILTRDDFYREDKLNGTVCPVNNGSIPIKVIPDLSSFYYAKVEGKTVVYADVSDGKISKDVIREKIIDDTQGNRPNGYAKLDESGKLADSVLPDQTYVLTTSVGKANGVCPLDSSGKVPNDRLNTNLDIDAKALTTIQYTDPTSANQWKQNTENQLFKYERASSDMQTALGLPASNLYVERFGKDNARGFALAGQWSRGDEQGRLYTAGLHDDTGSGNWGDWKALAFKDEGTIMLPSLLPTNIGGQQYWCTSTLNIMYYTCFGSIYSVTCKGVAYFQSDPSSRYLITFNFNNIKIAHVEGITALDIPVYSKFVSVPVLGNDGQTEGEQSVCTGITYRIQNAPTNTILEIRTDNPLGNKIYFTLEFFATAVS